MRTPEIPAPYRRKARRLVRDYDDFGIDAVANTPGGEKILVYLNGQLEVQPRWLADHSEKLSDEEPLPVMTLREMEKISGDLRFENIIEQKIDEVLEHELEKV